MEYLTRNGVSINVIEVCQQIYIFQNRKDETIWSKNNLQPGLSRSTNILIRRNLSLFLSLSRRLKKREGKKEKRIWSFLVAMTLSRNRSTTGRK